MDHPSHSEFFKRKLGSVITSSALPGTAGSHTVREWVELRTEWHLQLKQAFAPVFCCVLTPGFLAYPGWLCLMEFALVL